jgi:hypothetical protein
MQGEIHRSEGISGYTEVYRRFPKDRVLGTGPMARVRVRGTGLNSEPEYEISEILDSKTDRRRRPCDLLYLVRWAGYEGTNEETSWVLVTDIVTDFHSAYPAKPRPWAR